MNNIEERYFLDVPYRDKDKAKELGAWWDPEMKKWYVPKGIDKGVFRKWFPQTKQSGAEEYRG